MLVRRFPYFYPYFGLTETAKRQMDLKGGNLFSWQLGMVLARMSGLDLNHLHTGRRLGGIARTVSAIRRIPYVISLHGGGYDAPADELRSYTDPAKGAFEWGKLLGMAVGSRRVIFAWPLSDEEVGGAYHGADVLVLPSIHEPFGIVILEAWASGLPVVATRVGGVVDLVNHGHDGLLVDSSDDVGLAGAIESVLVCRDACCAARFLRQGCRAS